MSHDANDDSYDYDENEGIDDDEIDSLNSGESGKKDKKRRNIPDVSLYQFLSKKRRLIHFLFNKIIIITFIFTLIYNFFFIIKIKNFRLEKELVNFKKIKKNIITNSLFFLIKGFCILLLPLILCGFEKGINDLNFSCLFINSLTSIIMSICLTPNKKNLNLDNNFKLFDSNKNIKYWVNLYYITENLYIKGVVTLFIVILSIVVLKIGKELWKAIR